MNSAEFDREFDLEQIINRVIEEDEELLERLGSDYDEKIDQLNSSYYNYIYK